MSRAVHQGVSGSPTCVGRRRGRSSAAASVYRERRRCPPALDLTSGWANRAYAVASGQGLGAAGPTSAVTEPLASRPPPREEPPMADAQAQSSAGSRAQRIAALLILLV